LRLGELGEGRQRSPPQLSGRDPFPALFAYGRSGPNLVGGTEAQNLTLYKRWLEF